MAETCGWEMSYEGAWGDELSNFRDILWSLILEKLEFQVITDLKCLSGSDNSILVQDKDKLFYYCSFSCSQGEV